jgi:hypothetical protein
VGGQRHAPTALPPGKSSGTQYARGWVRPRPGLHGHGKNTIPLPHWGSNPEPSSPLRVAVPSKVSRSPLKYTRQENGLHSFCSNLHQVFYYVTIRMIVVGVWCTQFIFVLRTQNGYRSNMNTMCVLCVTSYHFSESLNRFRGNTGIHFLNFLLFQLQLNLESIPTRFLTHTRSWETYSFITDMVKRSRLLFLHSLLPVVSYRTQ